MILTFVIPCGISSILDLSETKQVSTFNIEYITYHTDSELLQLKDVERISLMAYSRFSAQRPHHKIESISISDYTMTSPVYKKLRFDKEFNYVV